MLLMLAGFITGIVSAILTIIVNIYFDNKNSRKRYK